MFGLRLIRTREWKELERRIDQLETRSARHRHYIETVPKWEHEDWCIGGERGPCNCGAEQGRQSIQRRQEISHLYRTIGSHLWLDSITDEEFVRLRNDVIPVFVQHGKARIG